MNLLRKYLVVGSSGSALGFNRLIGQRLGAADFINAHNDRLRQVDRRQPNDDHDEQQHEPGKPHREYPQVPVTVYGLAPNIGVLLRPRVFLDT